MAGLSLFGRDHELQTIHQLIDGAADHGAALLLRGEAGIGKSALLAAARQHARERGLRVLATSGVQAETHLPFAGLHQLLRPVLAGVEALPIAQRQALLAAFGMSTAAAPDRSLIALASLELLADAAARAPLLLLADDEHWLDPPSRDVLAFMARRLAAEPIALIAAVRDEVPSSLDAGGLPELRVGSLDSVAAEALLDARADDLDTTVRARLLDEAAGNPLALVELPSALGVEQRGGIVPLPPWLPLTTRLERAFALRAAELPPPTRELLLVAAADDGGALAEIIAAGALLIAEPVPFALLDPAVDAGLIEIEDSALRFRHPLMRSAIYQAAGEARRRSAHAALASVLGDQPDRRIWHRAAATIGHDKAIAAELDEAAWRAHRRGAVQVEAAARERAALLTAPLPERGQRLMEAAQAFFNLGQTDAGLRLLREVDARTLNQTARSRLAWLREIYAGRGEWSGTARIPAFIEMADDARLAGDPASAVGWLVTSVLRCWWANPPQSTRDLVVAAAERFSNPDEHPALLYILACADPVARGAVVLDRFAQLPPVDVGRPILSLTLGVSATAVGDFERAEQWLGIAVAGLRAWGSLNYVRDALLSQAWTALFLGQWSAGLIAAVESASLSRESGHSLYAAVAQLAEATLTALRGRHDDAEHLAAAAEAEIVPIGAYPMLALVQLARGVAALSAGHPADAYAHLRRIFDPADIAYHPFVRAWAIADLAEAASRSGNEGEARAFVGELLPIAEAAKWPVLRAGLAYALPILAHDEEAEEQFATSLPVDLRRWPFFEARLQLAYGIWLRRQGRIGESRAPLRAAREAFDALGALRWGELARQELQVAGETSHRRVAMARDSLTPQELQVALLAAEGLSNREIGQQLYLSHRTISTHLYRIYPKLGIAGRAELHAALDKEYPSPD